MSAQNNFLVPFVWFKETFAIFKKQPMRFFTLALFSVFTTSFVASIPFAGDLLGYTWWMFCSLLIAVGTYQASIHREVTFAPLVKMFRTKPLNVDLFTAGLALAAFQAVMMLLARAFGLNATIELDKLTLSSFWDSYWALVVYFFVIFVITSMASWFSPLFVGDSGMPAYRSLFYSFFMVVKNWKALLTVYILYVLFIAATIVCLVFIGTIIGLNFLIFIVPLPFIIIIGFWHMMTWVIYKDIIGVHMKVPQIFE